MRTEFRPAAVQTWEADPAAQLLERRFFAVLGATRSLQSECDTLSAVVKLADAAWRCSRQQLAELEMLRDALDAQLCELQSGSVAARSAA
jgi:hypothetical protein